MGAVVGAHLRFGVGGGEGEETPWRSVKVVIVIAPRQWLLGKPRSICDGVWSGHRVVTTFDRV